MNKTMTYTLHPFHFIYLCILLLPPIHVWFFPTDVRGTDENTYERQEKTI